MNDIDAEIRRALADEDAELFAEYGGELSLHEQVLASFRGRMRWLLALTMVFTLVFFVLAIVAGFRFFAAEDDLHSALAWGLGCLLAMSAVQGLKTYYWMELQKNSVLREVKRVELQLARLARSVRDAAGGGGTASDP